MCKATKTVLMLIFLISCLVSYITAFADNGIFAFEQAEYIVVVGKSAKIKAVAQHIESKLSYEWISGDEKIATVSNGNVKGISDGHVEIVCKATAEDGTIYTAKCVVVVNIPIKRITTSLKRVVLGEKPLNLS